MKLKRASYILALGYVGVQCWHPVHANLSFSFERTIAKMIITPPDVHAISRF
jgi:hypothetical protein